MVYQKETWCTKKNQSKTKNTQRLNKFFLVDQKKGRNRLDNWSTKRLTKTTWTGLVSSTPFGLTLRRPILYYCSSQHFGIKLKYSFLIILKQEASFASVSFEVQQYDKWTDNILVVNRAGSELTRLKCKWTRKWKGMHRWNPPQSKSRSQCLSHKINLSIRAVTQHF